MQLTPQQKIELQKIEIPRTKAAMEIHTKNCGALRMWCRSKWKSKWKEGKGQEGHGVHNQHSELNAMCRMPRFAALRQQVREERKSKQSEHAEVKRLQRELHNTLGPLKRVNSARVRYGDQITRPECPDW